jgi:RHS repeat-associated protein
VPGSGPYGEPRTHTGTQQPYRYTSTYLDPSGLYKMGARHYDPALGRFTQPDPSGQENNPYLYATGDPVNHSDPTGLFSFSDALDVGGKNLQRCHWLPGRCEYPP